MSFRKTFLKNIFISGGYAYLSQLVNFFASFITSRLLLPSDFGLVGLITVFSGFITVFSDSGLSMAVIRSRYENTYHRGLNSVAIIIGLVLCILTLLLVYPISLFYKNDTLILPAIAISFLFIIRSFYTIPMAVLQKRLQFSAAGKILFISTIAQTISTIILAWMGYKYWSLIWSQYVQAIIIYAMVYAKTSEKLLSFNKPVFVRSFQLAKKLIGSLIGFNVVNYWARNADNLLVGKYYGTNDLGIYNRGYLMLQLPLNLITGLFNTVLFPSLVKYKNEGGNVEGEYFFILKVLSVINLPIGFILIIFPEQFVRILWGNNWIGVASLLPYFGLMVMIQTLLSTFGNILVLQDKERVLMFTGWVSAGSLIVGIIYGATVSLIGVAAFYTFTFVVFVFPFQILYVSNKRLHFTSGFLNFWLPRILLAPLLWIAIYFSLHNFIYLLMLIWTVLIIYNIRSGFNKAYKRVLLQVRQ